jgi:hypothetical protein
MKAAEEKYLAAQRACWLAERNLIAAQRTMIVAYEELKTEAAKADAEDAVRAARKGLS